MNLAILKGDVAGQRAEIAQAGCDWICLPVDDQSSSLTSKSCHWQMEDVAWWRYLVRQQGSSDILEKLLCCVLALAHLHDAMFLSYHVCSGTALTLDTLNCKTPRGSSLSWMVTSATSMPGLFKLGWPAPTEPPTSSTLVMFTRKLSASSGVSSLIKKRKKKKIHNDVGK